MNHEDYIKAREAIGVEPTEEEVLCRMVQDEERKMDKAKEDSWNPGSMTSWTVIEKAFTKNERVGSMGYQRALIAAADLFVQLQHNFYDRDEAIHEFNASSEVREALINRAGIKRLEESVGF